MTLCVCVCVCVHLKLVNTCMELSQHVPEQKQSLTRDPNAVSAQIHQSAVIPGDLAIVWLVAVRDVYGKCTLDKYTEHTQRTQYASLSSLVA